MEKKPLLDGSVNSYHSFPGEEKSKEEDIEQNVDNLRPWQRWKRNQVIPAIILLCGSFLGMMSTKTMGPSLLELQIRTSAGIDQVSWFMSMRALGQMSGALALGYFVERPSRWLQLCLTLALTGITFASIPWFTIYWIELFMFVVYGFFLGYILSGCQLTIYSLFDNKNDSVSWQNGCQLVYAIGGLFAPLIVEPFLIELATPIQGNLTTNSTNSSLLADPADVRVMYAYLIEGCLLIAISLVALLAYYSFGSITISTKGKGISSNTNDKQDISQRAKNLKYVFVALLILYYIIQSVLLRTFNNYLVPFVVNHLGWSKTQGTTLASVYFATSAIGKVIIILVVRHLSLEFLLFGGLTLSNIAAIALSFFVDSHVSVIWVFSIMSSLGSCITVSVLLAWTDKNVGIQGYIGAIYSWGGSCGEIAFNPVIGYLFENVSYISMMYLLLACSVTCMIIMIVQQLIGMNYRKVIMQKENKI